MAKAKKETAPKKKMTVAEISEKARLEIAEKVGLLGEKTVAGLIRFGVTQFYLPVKTADGKSRIAEIKISLKSEKFDLATAEIEAGEWASKQAAKLASEKARSEKSKAEQKARELEEQAREIRESAEPMAIPDPMAQFEVKEKAPATAKK